MAQRGAQAVLRGSGPMLVSSYTDLFRARRLGYGPFVLAQHGAGQSYGGDRRSAENHAYAGASGHEDVGLFVVPGPHPAGRWRERYPEAVVVEAGNTVPLPAREGTPDGTVAVTFHWPCALIPETGTAWNEYRPGVLRLAEGRRVLGHWHPRWGSILRDWYLLNGIEPVESLAEVARRADVLVADNTSALFQFAATGRPVVVVHSRAYRRNVRHGLRFWEAESVGVLVTGPSALPVGVDIALQDPAVQRRARDRALDLVYRGSVEAAAEAILQSGMM